MVDIPFVHTRYLIYQIHSEYVKENVLAWTEK